MGTTRVTSKVALWAGSSQQGRARRASAAWGRRERGEVERRGREERKREGGREERKEEKEERERRMMKDEGVVA